MKHIKNNLVPVSIFVLAVISFRLAGVSGRYLAAEVYTRFARNTLFTLALILPVTCGMGINFAIVVGAISAQMAMVFSVDLRLEGAVALMFVTGASIVLSILFGMMVAALLNRARGREMIVSIMIGQLSSVIYQFIFMVAYGLLIQPRNRDILLDRGIGVRSMVDARNISSVFKGILPFRRKNIFAFSSGHHPVFQPGAFLHTEDTAGNPGKGCGDGRGDSRYPGDSRKPGAQHLHCHFHHICGHEPDSVCG